MCIADLSCYKVNVEVIKDRNVAKIKKLRDRREKISLSERFNILSYKSSISLLFHGAFWGIGLILVCPLIGICFFIMTSFRILKFLVERDSDTKLSFNDGENVKELAIFVTGCDSGFGQAMALDLSEKGFYVFAGCLTKEGSKQYDGIRSIRALKLDVTKEYDSVQAVTEVSKWLQDPQAKKSRYLHAVINNAGIGSNGPIDWTSINDFENVMEVNYFGMIRISKAFLPILKSQATSRVYKDARILNLCSFAGHIALPGSPAYVVSKFAVERFSACLRIEMREFDVPVITVNPSVHGTTMLETSKPHFKAKWEALNDVVRNEYGIETYNKWIEMLENVICVTWEAQSVVDVLANSIQLLKPPLEVIVGMDAKFVLVFLKMLPMWLVATILSITSPVGRCTHFQSKTSEPTKKTL